MEQKNKKYEFRAITEKMFSVSFLMFFPLFIVIYFIMDKYVFYNEIGYNVFINLKTIGLPFIISVGFVFIISYLFFVKKYTLEIQNDKLLIYSNELLIHSLYYEQVEEIKFVQSKKTKSSTLQIYLGKKIVLIIGYFMHRKKDFYRYNEQIKGFIEDYSKQTNSNQDIKDNNQNITIILTKKD